MKSTAGHILKQYVRKNHAFCRHEDGAPVRELVAEDAWGSKMLICTLGYDILFLNTDTSGVKNVQ